MPKAKAPVPEKDASERWLLTYADMITLLLALFVVLFATSQIDATKFEEVSASFQRAFNVPVNRGSTSSSVVSLGKLGNTFVGLTGVGATIGPELISYAQREQLGDSISITASKDAVVITLSGALPFGSGSAELRPEYKQAVDIVGGFIRDMPDQNPVRVEGHTDNAPTGQGRFANNWELSAARAAAVASLLGQSGVVESRLSAVGFADTRPIGDNNTPEGRTRNRRVEIWILNPEASGTPTAGSARPGSVVPQLPSIQAPALPGASSGAAAR